MSVPNLGEKFIRWADAESSVHLLVLIGSQTRASGAPAAADVYSDWDFQVATSRPELFSNAEWTVALELRPIAYVFRAGRLGSAQKVTALFAEGELDLVIIPVAALRGLAQLAKTGTYASNPVAQQALTDLAAVSQGGYRILKGAEEFAPFYESVTREIPPARLSDEAVRAIAEGFVCDYVSTQHKIARGEMLAAQRWLHHQLAEVNFRLLHELRLREGAPSFPDARRLESMHDPRAVAVAVEALPTEAQLHLAVEKSATTCRDLVRALIGDHWQWPDLSRLRLRS